MIGIGCDIVEIKRIEKAASNSAFLKILTNKEYEIFQSLHGQRQWEWLAGRFAAKEAIYKAIHKMYPCVISDIEILSEKDGTPICTKPSMQIQVSIAHEKTHAIAYAYAIGEDEVCSF